MSPQEFTERHPELADLVLESGGNHMMPYSERGQSFVAHVKTYPEVVPDLAALFSVADREDSRILGEADPAFAGYAAGKIAVGIQKVLGACGKRIARFGDDDFGDDDFDKAAGTALSQKRAPVAPPSATETKTCWECGLEYRRDQIRRDGGWFDDPNDKNECYCGC